MSTPTAHHPGAIPRTPEPVRPVEVIDHLAPAFTGGLLRKHELSQVAIAT